MGVPAMNSRRMRLICILATLGFVLVPGSRLIAEAQSQLVEREIQ